MRVHLFAGILLVSALAGCAGEPPQEASLSAVGASEAKPAGSGNQSASANLSLVEAPEWSVGDAWTMGTPDGSVTMVVTQADASGYTLSTDSETVASFDAMFDISYLGRIRASDLAGDQGGAPVQFFAFPLEDGKKWSTTWDGLAIDLAATFNPAIPTPLGAQPGFMIEGKNGEEPYVHYSYVPALRWWSHLDFEGYAVKVEKVASNWTGTYSDAVAKVVFESATSAPFAMPGAGAFTVEEAQSFLMLSLVGQAPAHARALFLSDPSGAPYMTQTSNFEASPEPGGYFLTERIPATAGEWHIAAPMLHHPEGRFDLRVHQVAILTKALGP